MTLPLDKTQISQKHYALLRCGGPILACMLLGLLVAGCSLGSGYSLSKKNYISRAQTVPVTTVPVELGPAASAAPRSSHAVLSLPSAAGSVKDVREKQYINGTRQEILLKGFPGTPGQNVIDVSVRTDSSSNNGDRFLSIGKPSEAGIRSEILGRFPDVRMNIVTQPMRNRFGTFGLAIGRHRSGARCLFTWQWVDDLRDSTPGVSNITKIGALVGRRQLATSIRIRLCQKGVTVDQLAGYVQGLNVMGRLPVQRLITMDRRNLSAVQTSAVSQSGIKGSPLLRPVTGPLESTLTRGRTSASTKPVKRARKAQRYKRRRTVSRRSPARDYNRIRHYGNNGRPVAVAPRPAVAPGSRYLAPVQNAPAPAGAAAAAAPAATYRPSGGASLPPEAYRGPGQ